MCGNTEIEAFQSPQNQISVHSDIKKHTPQQIPTHFIPNENDLNYCLYCGAQINGKLCSNCGAQAE